MPNYAIIDGKKYLLKLADEKTKTPRKKPRRKKPIRKGIGFIGFILQSIKILIALGALSVFIYFMSYIKSDEAGKRRTTVEDSR